MTSSGTCTRQREGVDNDGSQIEKNGLNGWMRRRGGFLERSGDGRQYGQHVRNVFGSEVHASSKEKDGGQIDDGTPHGQENVYEAGKRKNVIDDENVTRFRRQRRHEEANEGTMIFGPTSIRRTEGVGPERGRETGGFDSVDCHSTGNPKRFFGKGFKRAKRTMIAMIGTFV